jgi:hypothetical protein
MLSEPIALYGQFLHPLIIALVDGRRVPVVGQPFTLCPLPILPLHSLRVLVVQLSQMP